MRVTMVENRNAAPDGVTVVRLAVGDTVDLPDELASRYVGLGFAVPADEAKSLGGAPENKDAGASPENKQASRPARARVRKA